MIQIKKIKDIFKMLEFANEIVKISGHAPVHPPNVCVGGMRKNISEKGKKEVEENAKKYLELMTNFKNEFKKVLEDMVENGKIQKELGNVNLPFLATHPYYGDVEKLDLLDINIIPPEKYYDFKKIPEETGAAVTFYKNTPTEVGPRARMYIFFHKSYDFPLGINLAYMDDAIKGCERIIEICDSLNVNARTRIYGQIRNGKGIGVHEAPRGTNLHLVSLREDGIIRDYRIIVPTMFNLPIMDMAIVGAPLDMVEAIIRSYDPCLSCATHVVILRDGKEVDSLWL